MQVYSIYAGTGVQFIGMTIMVLLQVFMGLFVGYLTAQPSKSFKDAEWKKNTTFMFPETFFCMFFVLDTLIWDLTGI